MFRLVFYISPPVGHQRHELFEMNSAGPIQVDLLGHAMELCLRRIKIELLHHLPKVLRLDRTVSFLVVVGERLVELCNLLLRKMRSH